jgi:hypothetical protein
MIGQWEKLFGHTSRKGILRTLVRRIGGMVVAIAGERNRGLFVFSAAFLRPHYSE